MEQNRKIAIIVSVVVVAIITYFVVSSVLSGYHEENFKIRVQNTLSAYGEQIDGLHIDGTIVIINIDPVLWRNTDEQSRERWMKEIVALIKLDAEESELINDSSIRVAFYDDPQSTKSVGSYRIDKK